MYQPQKSLESSYDPARVKRSLAWPGRLALTFLGYVLAVLVGVAAAIYAWLLPTVLPDGGAWGSYYAVTRDSGSWYRLGLMIALPAGLPGFLFTLVIAHMAGWRRWLPFACAGAINAVLALLIFNAYVHASPLGIPIRLSLSCLAGGFLGGSIYWIVVRRSLPGQGQVVSP